MTERPNHNTVAGKRYLALRALARSAGRPTAELLQLYVLEGFLARLERSGQRERLVLKGGALLSAFDLRRPTRDIDFLALSTPNDAAAVRSLVVGIANEALNDGLSFNLEDVSTETIREGDAYTGVRTSIRATLATARLHFHVDVNVSDPIWPGSQRVFVPRLLSGEAIELQGYPLAMVLAEKVVTAIQRGEANTRWRDFADVLLIAAKHPVAGADFHSALTRVASFRRTPLRPLADSMSGFDARADRQWQLWRRKHGLVERVPRALADVAKAVSAFADQAISGAVAERRWAPADGAWIPIARS